MIAVDTNVIVRYVMNDDETQSAVAKRLMSEFTPEHPGFICREVLIELVWVLERVYKLPRVTIGNEIFELVATSELVVENDVATIQAVDRYMRGGVDFADLLILAAAQRASCTQLFTFDRKLARIDGATLLEPT